MEPVSSFLVLVGHIGSVAGLARLATVAGKSVVERIKRMNPAINHDIEIAMRTAQMEALYFYAEHYRRLANKSGALQTGRTQEFYQNLRVYALNKKNRKARSSKATPAFLIESVPEDNGIGQISAETARRRLLEMAQPVARETAAEILEGIEAPMPDDFRAGLLAEPDCALPDYPAGLFADFLYLQVAEQVKTNERLRAILTFNISTDTQRRTRNIQLQLNEVFSALETIIPGSEAIRGLFSGLRGIEARLDQLADAPEELRAALREGFEANRAQLDAELDKVLESSRHALMRIELLQARSEAHYEIAEDMLKAINDDIRSMMSVWNEALKDQGAGNFTLSVPLAPAHGTTLASLEFRSAVDAFVGREAVLGSIQNQFIDHEGDFRYCVLHGVAGTGKSRIALELLARNAQRYPLQGFLSIDATLDGENLGRKISNWNLPSDRNVFLVIDDPKQDARWLRQFVRSLQERLAALGRRGRILFLARTHSNLHVEMKADGGAFEMEDAWHAPVEIGPLGDADLLRIVRGRAPSAATRNDAELLAEIAGMGAKIPLFAALVGIRLSHDDGQKASGEIEQVLAGIFEREARNWENIYGKRRIDALKNGIVLVTLFRGLSLRDYKEIEAPQALLAGLAEASELEGVLGVERPEDGGRALRPLRPDFLGEWCALDWLCRSDPEDRKALLSLAWERAPLQNAFIQFVMLATMDHPEKVAQLDYFRQTAGDGHREAKAFLSKSLQNLHAHMLIRENDPKEMRRIIARAVALEKAFAADLGAIDLDHTETAHLMEAALTAVMLQAAPFSESIHRRLEGKVEKELGTDLRDDGVRQRLKSDFVASTGNGTARTREDFGGAAHG